jgi:ATP-dependent Clp protease adapter protein ClpS
MSSLRGKVARRRLKDLIRMQARRRLRDCLHYAIGPLAVVVFCVLISRGAHRASALPVAWLVLAINAAFFLRFASGARSRASRDQTAAPRAELTLSPELIAVIEAARLDASRRGHTHLTLEHMLLALTANADVVAVLRACRADPEDLRRELEEYLALLTPEPAESLRLHTVLQRAAAHAQSTMRAQVDTVSVLVQTRREQDAYASLLLRAAGIELVDLKRCVSHGKPDIRPQQLEGVSRAALRLHNDDYTTMEFVVGVMRSFFAMDEAEAQRQMLLIHQEGSAIVATLPMDEAIERAERITEEAARAEYPLRCSLEAA